VLEWRRVGGEAAIHRQIFEAEDGTQLLQRVGPKRTDHTHVAVASGERPADREVAPVQHLPRIEPVGRLLELAGDHPIKQRRVYLLATTGLFAGDQRQQDGLGFRLLEDDGKPALVAIEAEKDRALAFDRDGLTARDVTGVAAFNFDHVSAKVAEYLRADRAHLDLGKVEDTNALER